MSTTKHNAHELIVEMNEESYRTQITSERALRNWCIVTATHASKAADCAERAELDEVSIHHLLRAKAYVDGILAGMSYEEMTLAAQNVHLMSYQAAAE